MILSVSAELLCSMSFETIKMFQENVGKPRVGQASSFWVYERAHVSIWHVN